MNDSRAAAIDRRASGPSRTPSPPRATRRKFSSVKSRRLSTRTVIDADHSEPRPQPSTTARARRPARYWMSVSSLNIGMYIEMMITPTTMPTPIIMSGSMTDVRVAMELSTSSS